MEPKIFLEALVIILIFYLFYLLFMQPMGERLRPMPLKSDLDLAEHMKMRRLSAADKITKGRLDVIYRPAGIEPMYEVRLIYSEKDPGHGLINTFRKVAQGLQYWPILVTEHRLLRDEFAPELPKYKCRPIVAKISKTGQEFYGGKSVYIHLDRWFKESPSMCTSPVSGCSRNT